MINTFFLQIIKFEKPKLKKKIYFYSLKNKNKEL